MTRAETIAHNDGVMAMIDLANAAAQALEERITEAPTRFNFAIGALRGVAEEGKALLKPLAVVGEPTVRVQGGEP